MEPVRAGSLRDRAWDRRMFPDKREPMNAKLGMSLFVNIVWLFVGGLAAFWIDAHETAWMIVGILIMVNGIVGINLAFAERNRK